MSDVHLQKVKFILNPVVPLYNFWSPTRFGLCEFAVESSLGFKLSLAYFRAVGEPLPQAFPPGLVSKMFIGLVLQPLVVLHKVHNTLFSCVPSFAWIVIEVCPSIFHPLCPFLCHFCLSLDAFQPLPPLLSVYFPFLCLLPSWLPPSVSVHLFPSLSPPSPRFSSVCEQLYHPSQTL